MPVRKKNFTLSSGESLDFQVKYVTRNEDDPSILDDVNLTNYNATMKIYRDIEDILVLSEGDGILKDSSAGVLSIYASPQDVELIGVGTVDYKLFLTADFDENDVDAIMGGKIQVTA